MVSGGQLTELLADTTMNIQHRTLLYKPVISLLVKKFPALYARGLSFFAEKCIHCNNSELY
jgi:hypothetical protein